MVQRKGGSRRGTRQILRKKQGTHGKISHKNYLQTFEKGEKVVFSAESAVSDGMYAKKFHSKVGIIEAKQGFCYIVSVNDGSKMKKVITHPVHLKKIDKNGSTKSN
ncbi:MAG: 50S ribosomal protein L21e [Nanobdellota archaeon]